MATSIIALITSIVGYLMPVLIKLISYYLENIAKNKEAQKKFLVFVGSLADSPQAPVRVRESARRQRDRLDAMLKEIDSKETPK